MSEAMIAFVEKAGVALETTGLTRLSGRMLGWLLICSPREQSADDLVTALQASTGGVSTQARALIRYGFIERVGLPRDRRTYYRLREHAFEAAFAEQTQGLTLVRQLADEGLDLVGDTDPARERLTQMRDLFAFMEREWPQVMNRFHDHNASPPRRE
ncbi:MAG: transcriptional regulator [Ornithinimicrobium sp.]